MRLRWLHVWIVPALSSLVLAGCQQPGARATMEKRFARRDHNIHKTIQYLEDDEAKRPRQLQASLDQVGVDHDRDVARTEANQAVLESYFQREFERWERRWPFYERQLLEDLGGHPENIEPTVAYALD